MSSNSDLFNRAAHLNSQLRAGLSFEEALGKHLFSDDSAEVIMMLAGICDRPADLIKWLSQEVKKKNDWRRALLVKRCWEKSAASDDPEAREAVVDALLIALVTGIQDEEGIRYSGVDQYVRQLAIGALASIGVPVVKRLITLLEEGLGVGAGAAEALGMIGDERAVEPLIAALADKEWGDLRRSAAVALGRIGDHRAVAPIFATLADEDEDVHWAAADTLGKIGYPEAVKPLIKLLRREREELAWTDNLEMMPESTPFMFRLIGDADELAGLAAYALGKIREPETIGALSDALKDQDIDVRARAAEALGRIGDERAVNPLVAALNDKDADVRWYAVEALGIIGSRLALPALERAAREDDTYSSFGRVANAARTAIWKVKETRTHRKGSKEGMMPSAAIIEKTEDSSVPSLYKYCSPKLIIILKNREIRFTQPSSFNDPFELFPTMDSFVHPLTTALVLERMKSAHFSNMLAAMEEHLGEQAHLLGLPALVEKELENENSRQVNAMRKAIKMAIRNKKMTSEERRTMVSKARNHINEHFGVLSLTEKADSILMWSHYAIEHKGFVLEFDPTNSFFDRRTFSFDPIRRIRKVQYQTGRPSRNLFDQKYWYRSKSSASADLLDYLAGLLLLTKSSDWAYEQEWRLIIPFSNDDKIIRINNDDIHLIPLPPQCIRAVILGSRVSNDFRQSILDVLRDPDYAHVVLRRAHLDSQRFRVVIKDDESILENKLLKDILAFPDCGIQERIERLGASSPQFYKAIGSLSAQGMISVLAYDRSKQKKRMLKLNPVGRNFLALRGVRVNEQA